MRISVADSSSCDFVANFWPFTPSLIMQCVKIIKDLYSCCSFIKSESNPLKFGHDRTKAVDFQSVQPENTHIDIVLFVRDLWTRLDCAKHHQINTNIDVIMFVKQYPYYINKLYKLGREESYNKCAHPFYSWDKNFEQRNQCHKCPPWTHNTWNCTGVEVDRM